MTRHHTDSAALAEEIIAATNGDIVLAMPLGLGKANLTCNALFARAMADPSISDNPDGAHTGKAQSGQ